MILSAIKSGFKTTIKNIWTIILMVLPAAVVSALLGMFSLSIDYPDGKMFYGLTWIIGIFVTMVFESFIMGLFKSDETNHFTFMNTFTGFQSGITWLVAGLYAILMTFINIVFVIISLLIFGGLNVVSLLSGQFNASSFTPGIIVTLVVAAILALVLLAAYIYVRIALSYIYLGYYDVQRTNKNVNPFAGFVKSWKVMKHHKWQMVGLGILSFLIGLAGPAVLGIVALIIEFLFMHLLSWNVFAIFMFAILFVLGLLYEVFAALWIDMVGVKFYEAIK